MLWEASSEGFEGRSTRTRLLLSAQTYWYAQTGTLLLPSLLQGRRNILGSCQPRELAGTTLTAVAILVCGHRCRLETRTPLQT